MQKLLGVWGYIYSRSSIWG